MENTNQGSGKKASLSKILVPLLIVIIVAGIWFVKNLAKNPGLGSSQGESDDLIILHEDFALDITKEFDFEQLKEHGLPIILDFGSESCPPCRQMAPILKKVHMDMQGKAIIKYIDVDKFQQIAGDYPVKVVPTQFFFDKEGGPFNPKNPQTSNMLIYTTRDTEEHVLTAHEGGLTEDQLLEILVEMGVEE